MNTKPPILFYQRTFIVSILNFSFIQLIYDNKNIHVKLFLNTPIFFYYFASSEVPFV